MIYGFAKILFCIYLRVFNCFKIIGKENLLSEGPFIIFGNHFSDMDIFAYQQLSSKKIVFMAKKQLFDTPVVGFFAKHFGAIRVDREGNDISAIKAALTALKSKQILGIYPEGTRVRDGSRPLAKSGMAMLAYKTKVPVIPVHIKYKRKCNLFNKITLIVGKPIYPDDLCISEPSSEAYQTCVNQLMDGVYRLE